MSTIRLADPTEAQGRLREIFDVIERREEKVFGSRRVSNVWLAQAHWPAYLEANWERSRATMQRGHVPAGIKEMVAVGTSVVNTCHY